MITDTLSTRLGSVFSIPFQKLKDIAQSKEL